MFQIFNINFHNILKKENSIKFTVMGILLILLGIFSFLNKYLGIKVISIALGLTSMFFVYLNFKNINELKRYASKKEIRPFINLQIVLLTSALLLFLFPEKTHVLISCIAGAYIIIYQIKKLISNKNNPYYRLRFFNVIVLLFGFTLILSPLLLSRFIVSILSSLIIFVGSCLIFIGNKFRM